MSARLAVLLSGPRRYAPLVLDRLADLLPGDRHRVLVHLWRDDTGEKARPDFAFAPAALRGRPEVIYLAEEPGFRREDFPEFTGGSNSGSPPQHSLGMFSAIMHLSGALRSLGGAEAFDQVLRLRTDCLLHTLDLTPAAGGGAVVSDNPVLPANWVSDHLWLSDMATFLRVWDFGSRERLVRDYLAARRNPERLLARRARQAGVTVERRWRRWVDYSIVYGKSHDGDPAWLREVSAAGDMPRLFRDVDRLRDPIGCERHFAGFTRCADPLSNWALTKQTLKRWLGRSRGRRE